MPYWERVVYAGETKEVKRYYSRKHKPKEKRIERGKETVPSQEQVNIRRQIEKLRWALNCNFKGGDMHVVFKFSKEERPDSYKELVKIKDKLLGSLKYQYRKKGKAFKFVYVLETGSRGAMHIHMVMENTEPQILSKCWKRGHIHISVLDDTGQYGELASYLVKEKGIKKKQRYGGKTYSTSRNLEKPIVETRVIWDRDFYREDVKKQKGYYIDKSVDEENGGVRKGFTKDGYPFVEYILVRVNQTWKEKAG